MPLIQLKHRFTAIILVLGVCVSVIPSCTVVKRYPKSTPFIYENTVNFEGKVEKSVRGELRDALMGQIVDSAMVRDNSELPWPKFPWFIPVPVIKKPAIFDSVHVIQSTKYMHNLLLSRGYRSNIVSYDSSMKKKGDQFRVKVNYKVLTGNVHRLNNIVFNLSDSNLQRLALESSKNSLLKKGDPMDYGRIDAELSRLVRLWLNSGYFKITRDEIFAEADSSYAGLIDPSIDQFEYLRRLAEIEQNRKKNPTVDIYIRQHTVKDSTRLLSYRVGRVIVFPDAPAEASLTLQDTTQSVINDINIISFNNTFKPSFIARFVELKPGAMYQQENYSKTLNNFNRLGAWSNINIVSKTYDSSQTIDYLLRLSPAKKQYFSVDLEGSSVLNTNQLVLVGSGRVGLAVNFRLKNRNIGKRAIQLENTLRTGIEFNDFTKILSNEVALSNRFTIPWMMTPFSSEFEKRFLNARTIVTFDFSYINRFQYYELRTFNTFFGYEWKPQSQVTWQFKPINIEYTLINPDSLFKQAILDFPLLAYSYNNGLIIGSNGSYNRSFNPPTAKHINSIHLYGEVSGILTGALLNNLTSKEGPLKDLFRFFKLEADYRHIVKFKKSVLVYRALAGYGKTFPTQSRTGDVNLPFFKSYFAGGPNSMRGWQIRKLGIGHNITYDTINGGTFSDKYADIQIETNLEYRFNLFRVFGFWFRGAVFTDIGNIWFRNDLNGTFPGAELKLSTLYQDIAIATGFGVRMDFSYFVLRFDLGYPIKDPRFGPQNINNPGKVFYSPNQNGWFVKDHWNQSSLQFAIGYPF